MIAEGLQNREIQASRDVSLSQCTIDWANFQFGSFMQSSTWLVHAWRAFHCNQPGVDPNSFRSLQVKDLDGSVVGGSLWFRQTSQAINWWRMSGSGTICSDYTMIPSAAGFEEEVGICTAEWLDCQPRKALGFPTAIEVDGIRADCQQWKSFFSCLSSRGWSLDIVDIESAWRLQLPDTWWDYEKLLAKTHRRKARKAMKLIESHEAQFRVCRNVADMERLWPAFVELHQKRRQLLGQEGCFADSDYERFLKSSVLDMAAKEIAWFSCVSVDGKPIAILLIFDWQETSYLYQSGIDTARLDMEPGHMVNAATIQACIDAKMRYFDFLRGDERYKSDWRAERVPLQRCIAFPPGLAGRSIASSRRTRRRLMNWIQSYDQKPTGDS